jgi:hypothetical protein
VCDSPESDHYPGLKWVGCLDCCYKCDDKWSEAEAIDDHSNPLRFQSLKRETHRKERRLFGLRQANEALRAELEEAKLAAELLAKENQDLKDLLACYGEPVD